MPATMPPAPPPSDTMTREAGRTIFGAGAQGYHAVRSGYPGALFTHLKERTAPAPRILEIGPGSGLATEGLLALAPAAYVGVESDADFVAYLRGRFAAPNMKFINAPFPCLQELGQQAGGPFDLAACAAAFHWLEPEPALAAIKALLRPDGLWAMWWNSYLNSDVDCAFGGRALAILRAEGVALPPSFGREGHLSFDVAGQTALLARAGMRDITHRRWDETRRMDIAAVTALFDSFSFIRALAPARQAAVIGRITAMVEHDFAGTAPVTVVTQCYTALNAGAGPAGHD